MQPPFLRPLWRSVAMQLAAFCSPAAAPAKIRTFLVHDRERNEIEIVQEQT